MDQNSSNLSVEWFDPPVPLVRVAATRRAGRSRCPARSAPPPPQLAVRLDCAAAAVSIRVVQPIALRHRLRSSSRQPPERASGTRDPSPSRRAARNGRLHGRLLHVPLLRLQPQIHPFRLPEFQVTPISSIALAIPLRLQDSFLIW